MRRHEPREGVTDRRSVKVWVVVEPGGSGTGCCSGERVGTVQVGGDPEMIGPAESPDLRWAACA